MLPDDKAQPLPRSRGVYRHTTERYCAYALLVDAMYRYYTLQVPQRAVRPDVVSFCVMQRHRYSFGKARCIRVERYRQLYSYVAW